jgi:hypothetical protein
MGIPTNRPIGVLLTHVEGIVWHTALLEKCNFAQGQMV